MALDVVERLPKGTPPAASEEDVVTLDWHDRARTRQRVRSRSGRELVIKLETGVRLPPGSVLAIGAGWHVTVEAASEYVWVITAPDRRTLLRVAWEMGNRHFPIDLRDDEIAVLYDHTLEELWPRLGVTAERARRPFLSEGRPPHRHD